MTDATRSLRSTQGRATNDGLDEATVANSSLAETKCRGRAIVNTVLLDPSAHGFALGRGQRVYLQRACKVAISVANGWNSSKILSRTTLKIRRLSRWEGAGSTPTRDNAAGGAQEQRLDAALDPRRVLVDCARALRS